MKKIFRFWQRGVRALIVPIASYLLLQLLLDIFAKISFDLPFQSYIVNTLFNVIIWSILCVAVGVFVSNRYMRKAAWKWANHNFQEDSSHGPLEDFQKNSPDNKRRRAEPKKMWRYTIVRFFLGSDEEEQKIRSPEVIFELVPGDWKLGMQMSTFIAMAHGIPTEFSVIMEPSVPVMFTGALHIRKTSDVIFTGRTIVHTAITASSLGTKFDINPDLELKPTKGA